MISFISIMGLNKRKKPNQSSLSSSEAEYSDNEQDTHLVPQNFPRFIIIESTEENASITSLSPFVIQKVLQGIAGEPKSIKKLTRSNQLLIEVSRKAHAENLRRTQKFHDLKVRVFPHSSLNSSRGVIRCPDLRGCSEQEILEEMKTQGVTAVKRFRVRKDGQLKDTNTFVFTFNTPVLPSTIKIAFLRVNVEVYIPNPLRCFNCQQYGHHEDKCKTILFVPNVANKQNIMKVYVKIQLSVRIVEKPMTLTQRNAKFGRRKKKYSELNLHVISLFLKHGKSLNHQLLFQGPVMLVSLNH